jgi:hypothetical protein
MSATRKVLTVSYGSFSCTLEGFDDAVGTMRAIAEYFREMSAHSPHFGTLPPAPDTDALRAIAERESRRAVDAQVGREGVVLRPNPGAPERATDVTGQNRPATSPAPTTTSAPSAAVPVESAAPVASETPPAAPAAAFAASAPAAPVPAAPDSASELRAPEAVAPAPTTGTTDRSAAPGTAPETAPGSTPPRHETVAARLARLRALVAKSQAEAGPPATSIFADDDGGEPSAQALSMQPHPRQLAVAASEPLVSQPAVAKVTSGPSPVVRPGGEQSNEASGQRPGPGAQPGDLVQFPRTTVAPETRSGVQAMSTDGDKPQDNGNRDDEAAGPHRIGGSPAPAEGDAAAADPQDESPRESHPAQRQSVAEDEVERLVETARSQFEEAGNKRRLTSMSHLKAAVAATVAERVFGTRGGQGMEDEQPEISRYREDLSKLVPARTAPATEAAEMPLVLGAAQRVQDAADAAAADDGLGDRLRGMLASAADQDETGPQPVQSFRDFAQLAGAVDLMELLEAAAAYLALHEGREQFSRPQIMRKVAAIKPEGTFTREDGLRSFGALIRQGRIQKLRRGQFTISQNSRFTTQQRGASL